MFKVYCLCVVLLMSTAANAVEKKELPFDVSEVEELCSQIQVMVTYTVDPSLLGTRNASLERMIQNACLSPLLNPKKYLMARSDAQMSILAQNEVDRFTNMILVSLDSVKNEMGWYVYVGLSSNDISKRDLTSTYLQAKVPANKKARLYYLNMYKNISLSTVTTRTGRVVVNHRFGRAIKDVVIKSTKLFQESYDNYAATKLNF